MKIGVLKLGARVSFSSQGTSGGTGEAISIINMLHKGGAEVVVFTKILKKDVNPSHIEFRDIMTASTKDIDALLVINGRANFFGGAEDAAQIMNYKLIAGFDGPVSYTYCDPDLTLVEVAPAVAPKPWASNWNIDEITIGSKKIRYISQPYDTAYIMENLKKNVVKPSTIVHYPFEKFPCMNEPLAFNDNPSSHLSYGGTMRGGKRAAKMSKFYFDLDPSIKVEMFGKIKNEDFKEVLQNKTGNVQFTGAVSYDKMLSKMNDSMCHVVIGDPFYEKSNDVAQRTYESIWSSVVTFIDADLDQKRRVYANDEFLLETMYVSTKEEVEAKIMMLADQPSIRQKIIQKQFDAVRFDEHKYTHDFVNLVASEF